MQKWQLEHMLDFPVEKVVAKMLDPRFTESWTVAQGGLNPKVEEVRKEGDRTYVRVYYEEKLPIGTQKARMEIWWNMKDFSQTFSRRGEGVGAKAKVTGEVRLTEKGGRTHYLERGEIDVPMPLVGGKIEKGVIEHTRDGWARKMAYLAAALKEG